MSTKKLIIEKLDKALGALNGYGLLANVVEQLIECVALIAHELPEQNDGKTAKVSLVVR